MQHRTSLTRIYLDYNASTPIAECVAEAMTAQWRGAFGNPSSVHHFGVESRYAVEKARRTLAKLIGASSPDEIIFTGGATESDNLAVRGVARAARRAGRGSHLITSAAEHTAVLDTCKDLRDREAFDLTILPVDEWGRVRPPELAAALRKDTILVSLMMANNENGAINPVAELSAITHGAPNALFHCDGVQALGRYTLSVQTQGIDLLSLTAHKIYGPKGIGLLYVREGIEMEPLVTGGGQERGRRGGTENVAGIVGFAEAAAWMERSRESENDRLLGLREDLWRRVEAAFPNSIRNSPPRDCLPGTLNFSLPGASSQRLVAELDERGFAVSAGSACTSSGRAGSHVILALSGGDEERASSSLRISLGHGTAAGDIASFVEALEECVALAP
ncbi:cysteine desulfurase [Candidatus Poribacteria bacterium]|nr:cysteine desulfurase [Candidatus Poribacteria bacterium]